MKKLFIALVLIFLHSSQSAKPRLIDFATNKYSQFGEDGMIQKIFELIGTLQKWRLNLGHGMDSIFLTPPLYGAPILSWKGILIEGDPDRFKELQKNTAAIIIACN